MENFQDEFATIEDDIIPIALVGFYNGSILPEIFYYNVPAKSKVLLNPSWELFVNKDKARMLSIFVFCFPYREFDSLTIPEKILFSSSIKSNIYIVY